MFCVTAAVTAHFVLVASVMVQGKQVSEDLAWAVIRMFSVLPISQISAYTGLSIRKIRYIKALHMKTGEVVLHRERGRKRKALDVEDVDVSLY